MKMWSVDEQRELLLLDTRRKILEAIYRHPGVHFRELERLTGLATGQLEYHLDKLMKAGLVEAEEDGRYVRYFPTEASEEIRTILTLARRPTVSEILAYLLENGEATGDELRRAVGVSASAITWHMKRLVDAGVVTKLPMGRKVVYRLRNPEAVARALEIQEHGLLDILADRLARMWEW